MLGKILISALLLTGLCTTTIVAKGNISELSKITSKHETLSKNLITAYSKKDKGASALTIIKTLESEQKTLKSHIKNPEITNLLTYLNMCIKDLKIIVNKPYSSKNAQKVAELSTSLQEGSHYIGQSI